MLKITKGLNPYLGAEEGVSIYTDDDGNEYVRVKIGWEDFFIALHDYSRDGEKRFTWDEAMALLKADGLTTFTHNQILMCITYHNEINSKLREIGGDEINGVRYWTATNCGPQYAWVYSGFYSGQVAMHKCKKKLFYRVRPIFNLTDK